MWRHGGAWMQSITAAILTICATGCASVAVNPAAICDGTAQARADHAGALAVAEDDAVVVTGAKLIRLLDAGCAGG